jgi:uncharacterized damage-inducible protein DinB
MNFDDAKRQINWEYDYYIRYLLTQVPDNFMNFRIKDDFPCTHEILTHMIETADDFFVFHLFFGYFLKDKGISIDFAGKSPGQVLETLDQIRELEIAELEKIQDKNYYEMIHREDEHWISLGIAINHVSEHKSYHMGQLFWMADLAGLKLSRHKLPYGIEP